MGRTAHTYSSNKVSLLNSALQYFMECDASLPDPINLPRLPKVEKDLSRPSSPDMPTAREALATFHSSPPNRTARNSMMAGISRMIDASLLDLDDPFIDNDDETDDEEATPQSTLLPNLWAVKDRSILVSSRIPKPTKSPTKQEKLKPSPLRISKAPGEIASDMTAVPANAVPIQEVGDPIRLFNPAPRFPLTIIPIIQTRVAGEWNSSPPSDHTSPESVITVLPLPSEKASPATPPTSPLAPTPTTPQDKYIPDISIENLTPVRAAQIVRSNRGIAFLHDHISTSITSLQAYIDQVQQLQAARRARKLERATSLWNNDHTTGDSDRDEQANEADPLIDESGTVYYKETKAQRIARLRSEGWKTVGLRSPKSTWKGSQYYQDLCAMVLNELDLNELHLNS